MSLFGLTYLTDIGVLDNDSQRPLFLADRTASKPWW